MRGVLTAVCFCALAAVVANLKVVRAAEPQGGGDSSFSEKVGDAAKKLEDKRIPEKVEQKFKKAADKTAEGFDKAGRKIKDKLAD